MIIKVLKYFHDRDLIHGNLQLDSIYMHEPWTVKIRINPRKRNQEYQSLDKVQSSKSDIWSLGAILNKVISNQLFSSSLSPIIL